MWVKDYMTRELITVGPEETLPQASQLMRKNSVRRLPVVEAGRVVGIVSDRDIREASPSDATSLSIWELNYLIDKIKVQEIMTRKVVTVGPNTPVEEAARLMRDHKIGGLPVVEDGRPVGIITENDIFRAFLDLVGTGMSRVEIRMGVSPAEIAKLAATLEEAGLKLQTLVSKPEPEGKRARVVISLDTRNPAPAVKALEQEGFQVLTAYVGPTIVQGMIPPSGKRALVPVLGTELSRKVVKLAARMARGHGFSMHILFTIDDAKRLEELRAGPGDTRALDEITRGVLIDLAHEAREEGIAAEVSFRFGDPVTLVLEEIARGKHDFVVIERRPLAHLKLLGLEMEKVDVAAELTERAPVPVMLINPETAVA
ncbi:MAG: CBS domain-containing protein [Deltaproteobacteria bacterium]|nr:CBS domain-containing protein [Deltaproteobacteria bacterium]